MHGTTQSRAIDRARRAYLPRSSLWGTYTLSRVATIGEVDLVTLARSYYVSDWEPRLYR